MPFNPDGSYELPAGSLVSNGQTSNASQHNTPLNDIASALSETLKRDGSTAWTENQDAGNKQLINLAAGTAENRAATVLQTRGSTVYAAASGTNTLTATLSPTLAAYAVGMTGRLLIANTNTGAVTLALNSLTAGNWVWPDGAALMPGDLPAGAIAEWGVAALSTGTPTFHLLSVTRRLSLREPGHRLTLTTALDVTVSDVTGASAGTIFWTPSKSSIAPIYTGSVWAPVILAELSFILDSTNHLSGKNHDVYLDYNAGTPRLLLSAAWTNDTTRADAISRDATYGWHVNNASITCRISNNGGTVSKGAGTLLYLGTIRCAANGQTEDSAAKRFVWNKYNRVPRAMRVLEATDTWSYATATIRQANNAAANQLDMVRGLDEDAVSCEVFARFSNDTAAQTGFALIGLDSTTAAASGCLMMSASVPVNGYTCYSTAKWDGLPGLGRHYLAWLERGTGSGTQTWQGDNGTPTYAQSGISGTVMA